MKLTKRDITSYLAKPSASSGGVLFFGPDEGQVSLYRKQALSSLLSNPADALAVTQLNGDKILQEPSSLFEAMSAMSLLGDAPIVIIDPANDKISPIIKEALSMPECQNFLIVSAGDLPARSALRALFEKEKNLASFACYRDEGEGLMRFLEGALRERGIRAERDAMHYLVSQLGNDRAITLQEVEKISLYLGETKTLSLPDARTLVGGNDNFSLDDLCLALGNGNFSAVFSLAEKLLSEGTNDIALLRSCARHFDRLKLAKYKMREGRNAEDAMNSLRPPVFYKHKPAFGKQLTSLSEQKIIRSLALLHNGENAIKHSKDPTAYCLQTLTLVCRSAA